MNSSSLKMLALHVVAIIFTIFNLNGVSVLDVVSILPMFDLMMVYYFAVYRPNIFSIWFIFIMGIWADSLNGFPVGTTALCYIIAVKLFNILNQHLIIAENFKQVLYQFLAFISFILFLKWALLSVYHSTIYDIKFAILQIFLSSSVYIIMHKFFGYLSEKLIKEQISASGF